MFKKVFFGLIVSLRRGQGVVLTDTGSNMGLDYHQNSFQGLNTFQIYLNQLTPIIVNLFFRDGIHV